MPFWGWGPGARSRAAGGSAAWAGMPRAQALLDLSLRALASREAFPSLGREGRRLENPHTHLGPVLRDSWWPSGFRVRHRRGANGRWGARATHCRVYSTRAWRAQPAGRGSSTAAREAQRAPAGCHSSRKPGPQGLPLTSQRTQPPQVRRQPSASQEIPGDPADRPSGVSSNPSPLRPKTILLTNCQAAAEHP